MQHSSKIGERQLWKGLPGLFEKQDSTVVLKAAHEQQLTELYAEIGKLTTQVAWLKKKLQL